MIKQRNGWISTSQQHRWMEHEIYEDSDVSVNLELTGELFQEVEKFFASPWSPPTWMKCPQVYNYGTLRWEKDVLQAYVLYFVKFVQAYEQDGIKIHQIHVQNEVIADQKFPSCVWTGEQLKV